MELLAQTNELPGVPLANRSRTVLALFDEPLTGETVIGKDALSDQTLQSLRSMGESAASILQPLLAEQTQPRQRLLQEMTSVSRLTAYAGRKTLLGQQIRRELRGLARIHLQPEAEIIEGARQIHGFIQALKELQVELERLRAEFVRLWLARARRSEIRVSLGYFASLSARYERAVVWLEEQRQRILAGEALDAELETFASDDHSVLWQTWPD
jgi:hypothetical protein